MKRRAFLLLPLLTVVSQRLLAFLKPTPMDLEGPFYPEVPIPIRNNLVKHASGVARGQHLALTGRVTDLSGNPQAAVLVEIWQCKTGPQGKYDFTTLVPVPYAGRPPHIHVKIVQGHREMLTSQLYLKDGIADGGGSWNIANRAELVIDPKEISVDHFQAEVDFVIS